MPTRRPSLLPPSVIGTPEMRYFCIRSSASRISASGATVIGLTIIPLSDRFTRSTSSAWSSMDRFLWMMPMPPCCAMAIAISDSVTVSIAALSSGTFNLMFLVSRVVTSTCAGRTVECRGTRRMSSNVSAVRRSAPMAFSRISLICVICAFHLRAPRYGGRVCGPGCSALLLPVALLEFLAASAPARVVAADLRLLALHRLDDVVAADPRGLAVLRQVLDADRTGRGRLWREHALLLFLRVVVVERGGPPRRLAHRRRHARLAAVALDDRLQPPQVADDLFLDAAAHVLEEREAFFLVLDERIALAVAAQADAFLQVIERVEVILPLLIDDLQHDVAFNARQDLARHELFLVLVLRDHARPQMVAQLAAAHLVDAAQVVLVEREDLRQLALERRQVPLVVVLVLGGELLDAIVEDLFGGGQHVAAQVGDLVLAEVNLAFENLAAQRVDALPLLVHHVVVFEQVLADGKVLRFDLLLGALDGARHHAVLDRHPFFHAETLHQAGDAIRPEDAHQVVFERQEEA